LPLAALVQNSGRQKTQHCHCSGISSKLRQAKASALPLVALLQSSGRQKPRHCHWWHYFKTLAGKRLGIASFEMLLWLLKLQQANDLALPLVALLHNSGRQKPWHCPWQHYFITPAGKRLGIAAGSIIS
jgi:hypothetical protein